MTPEERRLLTDLASKISQTPPPPRDPEAEDFIRKNIGSRPDALYLMTQTVLIQNMAIDQAHQQIRDLQQRAAAQQPAGGGYGAGSGAGSFLGGQPSAAYSQPQPQYAPQQAPSYAPPQPAAPSGFGGGGAPSFLRGAAQTAAGVAAGALAFEGVRSLFSHPGFGLGSGLGLGQAGLMGGGMPVEETVVNNNYYDSPDGGRGFGQQRAEHLTDVADNSSDNTQNDSNSDDDDSDVQTQDADYDDSSNADDSSSFDDSSDSIA